jgi:hypothetical protein
MLRLHVFPEDSFQKIRVPRGPRCRLVERLLATSVCLQMPVAAAPICKPSQTTPSQEPATTTAPIQAVTLTNPVISALSATTGFGGMAMEPVLMWVAPAAPYRAEGNSMLFRMTPAAPVPPKTWPTFVKDGCWSHAAKVSSSSVPPCAFPMPCITCPGQSVSRTMPGGRCLPDLCVPSSFLPSHVLARNVMGTLASSVNGLKSADRACVLSMAQPWHFTLVLLRCRRCMCISYMAKAKT